MNTASTQIFLRNFNKYVHIVLELWAVCVNQTF